jgi:peptidoglycan hydrolase-like protein with peptidoglycan-binding domain
LKIDFARVWVFALLLGSVAPLGGMAQAEPATSAISQDQEILLTRPLVLEIQSMLLRLGLDPGPVDGAPRERTNRAVRRFEEMHGLPLVDLERGANMSADLLARLRTETARATSDQRDNARSGPAASSLAAAPPSPAGEGQSPARSATAAVTLTLPKPPPADRFASCTYDPEDFHIGTNRYTPETFLQEGFGGSAAHAVANLEDRLEEARQIADTVGVSALKEVQRQARVLRYFECRLKIEQASAGRN